MSRFLVFVPIPGSEIPACQWPRGDVLCWGRGQPVVAALVSCRLLAPLSHELAAAVARWRSVGLSRTKVNKNMGIEYLYRDWKLQTNPWKIPVRPLTLASYGPKLNDRCLQATGASWRMMATGEGSNGG